MLTSRFTMAANVIQKFTMGNEMKIGTEYKIEGDTACLTLYKRRVPEKGKLKGTEQWDVMAYYNAGRYDLALKRLVAMEVSGLEDLQAIAKMLDNFKVWIADALKE